MSNKKQNTIYDDLDILEIEENLNQKNQLDLKIMKNKKISTKEWFFTILPIVLPIIISQTFIPFIHNFNKVIIINITAHCCSILYIFIMAIISKKEQKKKFFRLFSLALIILGGIMTIFIVWFCSGLESLRGIG